MTLPPSLFAGVRTTAGSALFKDRVPPLITYLHRVCIPLPADL
jgi:hypothetical protein